MKSPRPGHTRLVRSLFVISASVALALLWLAARVEPRRASAQAPFTGFRNFESPQVHPLALTPDGKRLLAVNSPENRLSVFQLTGGSPVLTAEIPVGLEPVSVAARSNREAWVVNWLSDSVSIVDLSTGNVTRTIDVGDEPTDVLFAGANNEKAFVCVSGTMQVKVFDADAPTNAPQVVQVRGKQPRSLARDHAGARVFVSVFESGNQTAVVPEPAVTQRGGLPPPQPALAPGLPAPPRTGLVVRWDGANWVDERGDGRWTNSIPFRLADVDVVVIDAQTSSVSAEVRGVGTQIGNAVYDPNAARLLVVNTDAHSFTRFEPNLRGRFMRSRVSSVNPANGASTHSDINPHINYQDPAGSDAERAQSLGLPSDIARASDGTLYVAALGSNRVGVLGPDGEVRSRVAVGEGPTGLALDESRKRLYVLNRFEQTLSAVDTVAGGEVTRVAVGFNPEPPEVREGRRFLYDTSNSAHGDVSCASCHPGGHRDGLVWDLGDPQGKIDVINNPAGQGSLFIRLNSVSNFHPMKGPMMTQSLRGIFDSRLMHWRGDRNNLGEFNPAFTNLLGRPQLLTDAEMATFQAFVRTLVYPPNPLKNLDSSLSTNVPGIGGNAQRGFTIFNGSKTVAGVESCGVCHELSVGTNSSLIPAALLREPQDFKTPQLRGLYQKLGMENTPGEKLTAFGFLHDGTFDNLITFLRNPLFTFASDNDRRDVAAFLLSFDTGVPSILGVQVTANSENRNSPEVSARLNLFAAQVLMNRCDLVVRGIYKGEHRSFLYDKLSQKFDTDRAGEPRVSRQELLDAVGVGGELTFTGVLLGRGRRLSIDADGDGVLNGDAPPKSVNVSGRVLDTGGNPVAGVTVALAGSQSATTVTDASGRYLFGYVSTAGTHIVLPWKEGLSFGPVSHTFVNPGAHQTADFSASPAPAIDASQFFVAQHYRDFFSREADAPGLQFWTQGIEQCGADVACRAVRRVGVSAAFFLSIEFQETGYLVYRTRKASFGNLAGKPVPVTFGQLTAEAQLISQGVVVNQGEWRAQLEANKQAFFLAWVERPDFAARYPAGMAAGEFVEALNVNAGSPLTTQERDALVAQLASNNTTQGRAAALRGVAENAELSRRESNRAFVLMQYFGYLRRDPDSGPDADFSGYNFWLGKLDEFNGDFVKAEMVKAFITSTEYRQRFGQ
ncbi:MAG TPA: carboxypeptidase regulatory-like domain-containing protein [Pyrinomonadaceae bacterium]|nr:carboxypeptidase regulatory-like domain-containing protein [Pyrinomonadaceae bacterium]